MPVAYGQVEAGNPHVDTAAAGQAQAGDEKPVAIFHSYTNLIQVPVLVLNSAHKPLPPIEKTKFKVSLDGGPGFMPAHVRTEGDDPISLSILLDVSGNDAQLMPQVEKALKGLSPGSLHARDHVSIFVLGCILQRFTDDVTTGGALYEAGVEGAVKAWKTGQVQGHGCSPAAHLWDSLNYMIGQMSTLPGRRIILAMTDGHDRGSKHTWNQVRFYGAATSVAIFGLMPRGWGSAGIRDELVDLAYGQVDAPYPFARPAIEGASRGDVFELMCELTGGLVLTSRVGEVGLEMQRFVGLVRGRYIVEFPRSDDVTAGAHSFAVTVDNSAAFVRASGKSVPLPDPEELADPSTQAKDPSKAPQSGNRKILSNLPQ
jgi:hypothetical protein